MAKAPAKDTKTKKKPAATPKAVHEYDGPRRLEAPKYKSFRMQKRIKPQGELPGSFKLLSIAFGTIRRHWRLFLGIVLIYGLLNALLVRSFSAAGNLADAKHTLDQSFNQGGGKLVSGLTLFVYLLGASGNTASPTAGAYQMILTLIVSLALIWALREVYAGNKVRIRDAFYLGMYPLVTFVMVLLVIGLQIIPGGLGVMLYQLVSANGIAVSGIEQFLWLVVLALFILVSLYMVASSLFALYIVCLPGMTPLRALRTARQLVAGRRFTVLRKVVFLPIAVVILAAIIVIPILLYATTAAVWVFFVFTMLLIAVVHGYLYALYRSLL
jgi:hypothetical protein